MEKQKLVQKKWYERNSPLENKEIVQISIQTHIKRLKDLLPIQKVGLSLNCGCGRGEQNNIFGQSIGIDISFENIRSLREAGG